VKKPGRESNLIDCLRLAAACCIILLHLTYIQVLPANSQELIIFIQQVFVSWALPFFYTITARFSLASNKKLPSLSKLNKRVGTLLFLMGGFTFLAAILSGVNSFLFQPETFSFKHNLVEPPLPEIMI
jgi:hypothetical protein